jgi:hypothetical protein
MILNQQDVPILINNSKSPTTPTKWSPDFKDL